MNAPHALVTGGGRGIGAAIAQKLLAAGYRVTITGRDAVTLAGFAASQGGDSVCRAVSMDVSDATSVSNAMAVAQAGFGPIHVLVNNAGQASSAPFLKADAALFERMWSVNLMGVVHCIQAALPDMLAAKQGRIINVASTAGLVGYAYVSAYVASKHAVIGLTRSLALELATKGITVNAVCPGYTETDIVKDAVTNIMEKTGRTEVEARADLAKGNPMKRLVLPHEVADAVLWLAGAGAASVTGQAIAVCGGELMH